MKHCWVSTYIKKSKKSPCLFNYQDNDKLIEPKRSAAIWLTLVSNRKGQPITGSDKTALQSWASEMRIHWTAFKDNSNDRNIGHNNKNLWSFPILHIFFFSRNLCVCIKRCLPARKEVGREWYQSHRLVLVHNHPYFWVKFKDPWPFKMQKSGYSEGHFKGGGFYK